MSTPTRRPVRAGLLITAGRGVQLVLQLLLTMVLARLLTPDDFGVQAMVFPIALLVQGIANTGLQTAVLQHVALDDRQASALFWTALPRNALLCLAMALVAPLLALVTGDTRFTSVAIAWALVLFLATLSAVHEARLKRDLRFGTVVAATLTGLVLSVPAAIMAARAGAGYWSFVVQLAVAELVRVVLVWWWSGWRPGTRPDAATAQTRAVQDLRAAWRSLSGSRVLQWLTEQSDRLVAGFTGGTTALGLYDAGKRWGTFAFQELHVPLTDVALASLTSARDEQQRLRQAARHAFLPILAISLPILMFVAVEPRGTILLVQGAQFEGAAPMLRAIALATIAASLSRLAAWVTVACGQADRQFRWMRVATPITLMAFIVGAKWGVLGVAVGLAVASAVLVLPSTRVLLAHTPVTARDVFPLWLVPFAASVVAGLALLAARSTLPDAGRATGLLVHAALFGAAYLLTWLVIPGGRSLIAEARAGVRGAT